MNTKYVIVIKPEQSQLFDPTNLNQQILKLKEIFSTLISDQDEQYKRHFKEIKEGQGSIRGLIKNLTIDNEDMKAMQAKILAGNQDLIEVAGKTH